MVFDEGVAPGVLVEASGVLVAPEDDAELPDPSDVTRVAVVPPFNICFPWLNIYRVPELTSSKISNNRAASSEIALLLGKVRMRPMSAISGGG